MKDSKIFCFDIDGVIMTIVDNNNYRKALPIEKMIKTVNLLYDKGHYIILHTARGSLIKKNWESVTKNQLKKYKVKYHELIFNKPGADYYIDDKMLSIQDVIELVN